MSDLNLKWLRSFRALAEHGSFGAAAEALNIAQPTLSAHIAVLEETLRSQLVWRTTRKVRLTPSGKRFLARIEHAVDELDQAALELRDQTALRKGRICLACMPTLAADIVPSAISEFSRKYPGVSVSLIDRPSKFVEREILDGGADFGIASKPDRLASLSYEPLATDRFVAVLSAGSKLANRRILKLSDLAAEPLIALAPSPSIRRAVEKVFAEEGLSFAPRFQVARQATALGMAQASLGVALIPETGLPRPLPQNLLAITTKPEIPRSIGIIRRRGDPLSSPAMELLKFLRRALRRAASPNRYLS